MWKKGLAGWGQDGERIRRLREAADFVIYTPGSSAGIPVSILRSFDAPGRAILDDADLLRERITTTVTSLLDLLGIDTDPLTEPGAHPAVLDPRVGVAAGQEHGHRRAHRGCPVTARPAHRGLRHGILLSESRAPRPGDEAQRLHRRPRDEGMGRGRAHRPGQDACAARRASRGSPSSPSPTSQTRSGCSSSPCSFCTSWRGRARSPAPPACGPSSTWTRSSATFPPWRTRRRRGRFSPCSSRRGPSAWAWCSRHRTPWTSTTRACPTRARGSSAGCRPSGTGTGCWMAWRAPRQPRAGSSTGAASESFSRDWATGSS